MRCVSSGKAFHASSMKLEKENAKKYRAGAVAWLPLLVRDIRLSHTFSAVCFSFRVRRPSKARRTDHFKRADVMLGTI
jgi:hypothetical protein